MLGVALNGASHRAAPHRRPSRRGWTFEALSVDPEFPFRPTLGGEVAPPLDEDLERIAFDKRRDYPTESLAWFHAQAALIQRRP